MGTWGLVSRMLTEQQGRVLRLLEAEKTQAEIAETLGVSKYRARSLVRRLCDIYDVDYGWEVPAAAGGVDTDDDDDGEIRVDGTHSTV